MEEQICSVFKLSKLKDQQKQVLEALSKKRDVFFSSKTGSGKSLCYQAFPTAIQSQNSIVLVIVPLIAIMKEQVDYLQGLGLTATYIGQEGTKDEDLKAGKFSFVFASPEAVVGEEKWRDMLKSHVYTERLSLIAVDEAHTVIQWGESKGNEAPFRVWFSCLGELRSLVPECPILAMTATASRVTRLKIQKKLSMKDVAEFVDNPDRQNVKLFLKKVKSNMELADVFQWLLGLLEDNGQKCERYLVFCKSIRECSQLYKTFQLHLPTELYSYFDMFHSMTDPVVKEKIRLDMGKENGNIRVLFCTNSAGMGVNYKGLNQVVNFGPPQDMDTFVQQVGRAGRSGEQAHHLLLYHARQLRNIDHEMLLYVRNTDECRRALMLKPYKGQPHDNRLLHLCCDICAEDCSCNQDDCRDNICHAIDVDKESSLDSATSQEPIGASVSEDIAEILRCSLYEYQLTATANQSLVDTRFVQGLRTEDIETIVKNCHAFLTPDDIMDACGVQSYQQAVDIYLIIHKTLDLQICLSEIDFCLDTEMDD